LRRLATLDEALVQTLVELLEIVECGEREPYQLASLALDLRLADGIEESRVHR
jgi:hypothetical protein